MAGNTKALRGRIKSVSSTLQLTKAMGLVASSKIRRAGEAMAMGREYVSALDRTLDLLTSHGECQNSPYMLIAPPGESCWNSLSNLSFVNASIGSVTCT